MNIQTTDSSGFPVVGLGASAGGLAAFEAFFSALGADASPGCAFVVLQHFAAGQKSILADLIRGYTRLPVFEAADGMRLAVDCVYVVPSGTDTVLSGGTIRLLETTASTAPHLPIDFFFRSLAQELREKAVGVILSGTGSDGTVGARFIKEEGGLVLVQKPASCEFDGMPLSALASGFVDFELAPADMPARISACIALGFSLPQAVSARANHHTDNSLKKIFALIRTQTGHDFSQYKPSTIHRRIERRMAVQKIETFDEYVKFIHQDAAEVQALFSDFLIGVTNFFRDPDAFAALEKEVIPALFHNKSAGSLIRVWVPGCSTGEEAYSLAILLAEYQETLRRNFTIQIFAADIDCQSIATARAGIYPAGIATDVSRSRLARFFTAEPRLSDRSPLSWRINKNIRDMLVFSEQDLIKDPPFSRIDLISCRNLLIYMGSELQKKVIPLFHYALAPGGYLFLGTSETVGEFGDLFSVLDRKQKIFRRTEYTRSIPHAYPGSIFLPAPAAKPVMANKTDISGKPSLRELTENALLEHLAPAAALVDSRGDILYLHGRTGLFLEPAPGEAGVSNIRKMAREGLQRDLTMALHRAAYQSPVTFSGVQVRNNQDWISVRLTVRALTGPARGKNDVSLFLVIMEQMLPSDDPFSVRAAAAEPSAAADTDARIADLRKELQEKEEYLQTTNEELETSNEELKSSYEEMQSVNEELQSTNEELETSKEELQSINEELSTVNTELQVKVTDLSRSENDMNNLLAGTGIATVFVDHALSIMRFTPAAVRIMNLIQSDVGRPVGHIVSNLKGYDTLLPDTQEVLDTLIPKEIEVQTNSGDWYLLRILPYRTLANVIEGAVLTFVDNSLSRKLAQSKIANDILATVREPLLVLDGGLRVVSANLAFFDTFALSPEAAVGKRLYDLGNMPWELPELRKLLEDVLPLNTVITDYPVSITYADGCVHSFTLNARRLLSEQGPSSHILLAIQEVTGQEKGGVLNG